MQQLVLLLSHRAGRIGLLIGLTLGFLISMGSQIVREIRNLTDAPVPSQGDTGETVESSP